jgi:hypothetical protein
LNLQSKLVIDLITAVSLQGIKLMVVFVNKYNHFNLKLHNTEKTAAKRNKEGTLCNFKTLKVIF